MDDRGTKIARRFKFFFNAAKKPLKFGAAVVLGVVIYKQFSDENSFRSLIPNLKASWTTSFEPGPSAKWDSNWDRRDPKSMVEPPEQESLKETDDYKNKLKKVTPTASRHLLLIRHGQYVHSAKHDSERFLTNLGRLQAQLTGERLKLLDLGYTDMISSTMTRAQETAQLIHQFLPNLEIVYDDILREGAPIPPEPKSGLYRPEAKYFQDGARIESAFRKYFHRADVSQKEDSFEIIVCHANVIRYCICRALQIPPEAWLRFSLAHASITYVTIRPSGNLSIRAVGDHGHIIPANISFS